MGCGRGAGGALTLRFFCARDERRIISTWFFLSHTHNTPAFQAGKRVVCCGPPVWDKNKNKSIFRFFFRDNYSTHPRSSHLEMIAYRPPSSARLRPPSSFSCQMLPLPMRNVTLFVGWVFRLLRGDRGPSTNHIVYVVGAGAGLPTSYGDDCAQDSGR